MVTTYTISASGKATIEKDPNAILDYPFDWSDWLTDIADTYSSHTIIAESPLVVVSSSQAAGVITPFISGGIAGTTYRLTVRIVTAGGRTDDRSVFLKIKER